MLTAEEYKLLKLQRELEAKLIVCLADDIDGLLSSGMEVYLENPWMEECVFTTQINSENDIQSAIEDILVSYKQR